MEDKTARLSAIKKLIKLHKITSQDQLLNYLQENGYNVTQATLSRDLKHLQVGKLSDGVGGYYYSLMNNETLPSLESGFIKDFERGFLSLEFSGSLGVVKSLPGHAQSIAYAIDNLRIFEILGTIAGDDTILLIPRDGISRRELIEALQKKIPILKEGI